jgi:hypothetical protein
MVAHARRGDGIVTPRPRTSDGFPYIGPNKVAALRLAADPHEVSAQVAVELHVIESIVARMVKGALRGDDLDNIHTAALIRHATTLHGLAL